MAAPRQFDEPSTAFIVMRVTLTQQREIRQVARENRLTVSEVLREATDEFVADYRESHPVFRRKRDAP
jgi:hypothetical protein